MSLRHATRDFTTAPSGSHKAFVPAKVRVLGSDLQFRADPRLDTHPMHVVPRSREVQTKPPKEK